jgi:hypothetical protein
MQINRRFIASLMPEPRHEKGKAFLTGSCENDSDPPPIWPAPATSAEATMAWPPGLSE